MKLLEGHVNNAHGQALAEKDKRCSYCDAAFDTIHELQEHNKIHIYFSCDICFAGFMSDVILIEHKIHDHPDGYLNHKPLPRKPYPHKLRPSVYQKQTPLRRSWTQGLVLPTRTETIRLSVRSVVGSSSIEN